MSSVIDGANHFDVDIARAKRDLFRSKRFIVATKRELEAHEQWLHRHNLLWQGDLKRSQRRIQWQRAIRVCTHLAVSLIFLVPPICRALLHGSIWFVKLCGRLAERTCVLGVRLARLIVSCIFLIATTSCRAMRHGAVWFLECCGRFAEQVPNLGARLVRLIVICIFVIGSKVYWLGQSVIEFISKWPGKRTFAYTFQPSTSFRHQTHSRELDKFRSKGRVRSRSILAGARSRRIRRNSLVDWTRHAALGPGLGIAAITLLGVGMAKPVGPGGVVLPVLPKIQSPARLAAVVPGESLYGRSQAPGPSPVATSGLTPITSAAMPEPPPLSGKNIASMMLLTTPVTLDPPDAARGLALISSVAMPEAPPLSGKNVANMMSLTTSVALANPEATKPAPATPSYLAEKPKTKPSTTLAPSPANIEVTKPAPVASSSLAGEPKQQPQRATQGEQAGLSWTRLNLPSEKVPSSSFRPHSSW